MKVILIDYTQDAVNKLLYTKATRLTQGEETRRRIETMTDEEKEAELLYMAQTVPSSWEFVNYTFEILGVTRAFTHQLVRTRTGSYAQQAMRINKMENFGYTTGITIQSNPEAMHIYTNCMARIQNAYDQLIGLGIPAEDARGLLPTNIHTNIIAQFNLRSLSDLIKKRTAPRVQVEYRTVALMMADAVLMVHPWAKTFLVSDKLAIIKDLERMMDQWIPEQHQDIRIKAYKLLDLLKKD
jgi:flavin-dependent thymidylate synthase